LFVIGDRQVSLPRTAAPKISGDGLCCPSVSPQPFTTKSWPQRSNGLIIRHRSETPNDLGLGLTAIKPL
jgi:hypothetical protein